LVSKPYPLYPLPLGKGKGKFYIIRGANAPLRHPARLTSFKGRGERVFIRGADATLKHPVSSTSFKGEGRKEREVIASLRHSFLSLNGDGRDCAKQAPPLLNSLYCIQISPKVHGEEF
jgi:hypothetical protein